MPPEAYCGGVVFGRDVKLVNDSKLEREECPAWTHIRVHWSCGLKEELKYFFDEVQRLVDLHGKVRFVFGFDSWAL